MSCAGICGLLVERNRLSLREIVEAGVVAPRQRLSLFESSFAIVLIEALLEGLEFFAATYVIGKLFGGVGQVNCAAFSACVSLKKSFRIARSRADSRLNVVKCTGKFRAVRCQCFEMSVDFVPCAFQAVDASYLRLGGSLLAWVGAEPGAARFCL